MKLRNYLTTAGFAACLGLMILGCVKHKAWRYVEVQETGGIETAARVTDALNDTLTETLPKKADMIEASGLILKAMDMRSYYAGTTGIMIASNGYVVGSYPKTSTDYETEQLTEFRDYLAGKGMDLLYISKPAKYTDDDFVLQEFGLNSYLNRNADTLLGRLEENGVKYLDLRDCLEAEDLNCFDLFYRTDHHWTVPASRWAAAHIAAYLQEEFGFDMDLSLYEGEKFASTVWEKIWLGEQGRKVAASYIGLDDYTYMEPAYETSFTAYAEPEECEELYAEGDFAEVFIDKEIYNTERNVYENPSWHYAYKSLPLRRIHNNQVQNGMKVLVLGDSYEASMLPFLALGIEDITYVIPRALGKKVSVRSYVEADDYDLVIVAYAQFMIGAHDNKKSANYRMFDLG